MASQLLLLLVAAQFICFGAAQSAYTVDDDASWAVKTNKLSTMMGDKQKLYNTHMLGCQMTLAEGSRRGSCEDSFRLEMNTYQPASMYNYTKDGFTKFKAPKELFDLILNFYKENKEKAIIEWKDINR
jgi:hypothetical protein